MANLNSINYPRILAKLIDYDANGNQKEITRRISDPEQPLGHREETLRRNLWDSEDRLRAVDLNPEADTDKPLVAAYTYDAAGERTVKYVPGRFDARYSAKETGNTERLEAMLYPSPLLTVKTLSIPEGVSRGELEHIALTKYTNHYYIGSERITSVLGTLTQLGILCEQVGDPSQAIINRMDDKVDGAGTALKMDHTRLGKTLQLPPPFHYNGQRLTCELTVYPDMYAAFWYHPDHLGSSSYITNLAGEITQHMEYLPFGETLVEEHLNSNNSPYKFNAKEYDAETGNYYYGARYYDPKFSIWLSVDPFFAKYPALSPYAYVANNPINAIDPDGRVIIFINGMHQGEGGNRSYWRGLDNRIMNKVGDRHSRYYDGSSGGVANTVTRGVFTGNNVIPGNRRRAGKRMGYNQAVKIFSNLSEGETIKIVTHSMGGAYGKGFIQGLKKYARKNNIDISDLIEFEIDLATFQPKSQEAQEGVPTTNISHEGDLVAGSQPMSGAENIVEREGEKRSLYEHSVDSFTQDEINKHVPGSKNNKTGSSVWEQNPKKD